MRDPLDKTTLEMSLPGGDAKESARPDEQGPLSQGRGSDAQGQQEHDLQCSSGAGNEKVELWHLRSGFAFEW
ncbi:hypothetical protein O6P37_28445, partial [Mycobacterium sp. CPCC 205372]